MQYLILFFLIIFIKAFAVGTHLNCIDAIQMGTHNTCFIKKSTKSTLAVI